MHWYAINSFDITVSQVKEELLEVVVPPNLCAILEHPKTYPLVHRVLRAYQGQTEVVDIHVHEYGDDCPSPNQGIADIVCLHTLGAVILPPAQPKQQRRMRSSLYRALILGYIEHACKRGFSAVHMTADETLHKIEKGLVEEVHLNCRELNRFCRRVAHESYSKCFSTHHSSLLSSYLSYRDPERTPVPWVHLSHLPLLLSDKWPQAAEYLLTADQHLVKGRPVGGDLEPWLRRQVAELEFNLRGKSRRVVHLCHPDQHPLNFPSLDDELEEALRELEEVETVLGKRLRELDDPEEAPICPLMRFDTE